MPWNLRFDVLLKEVNPLNFGGFFVLSSENTPTSTALLSRISVMLDFLLVMLLQLAPRKLSDTLEYLSLFVLTGFTHVGKIDFPYFPLGTLP